MVDRRHARARRDGSQLVVNLRDQQIDTWDQLWDALTEACGLPTWFGRNLDAWWDAIEAGGISDAIDDHPSLVVRVRPTGMFTPGNPDGARFLATTNQGRDTQATVDR
jgi:hypothetical protein